MQQERGGEQGLNGTLSGKLVLPTPPPPLHIIFCIRFEISPKEIGATEEEAETGLSLQEAEQAGFTLTNNS